MLNNNKGFSLIELMVVVAIIAILSTIAIPSFQVFQAKARQKEGFALLSNYYSAAQASRSEYGFFPGDFIATGFAPNGTLGYRLIANVNAQGSVLPFGQTMDPACITTATGACNTVVANYPEWLECGDAGTSCQAGAIAGTDNTIGPFAPTGASVVNNANFIIFASGVISAKAAAVDEYSMTDQKIVTMVTDGLK